MQNSLLTDKYRPKHFSDLVLPPRHNLSPAAQFLRAPYPSAWLFTGKSGIGKTSLAQIMARAASERSCIHEMVGPDLDSARARDLEILCAHRPLFGNFATFIVNEADGIPRGGQVRLLQILDNLSASVWVFTSNEDLNCFEERFLSRVKTVSFSSQGLLEPAILWLTSIAENEGISISRCEAEKIIRASKNNLRAALRSLELTYCETLSNHA